MTLVSVDDICISKSQTFSDVTLVSVDDKCISCLTGKEVADQARKVKAAAKGK